MATPERNIDFPAPEPAVAAGSSAAMRETADLIGELARALVNQAEYARRAAGEGQARGELRQAIATLLDQANGAQAGSERLLALLEAAVETPVDGEIEAEGAELHAIDPDGETQTRDGRRELPALGHGVADVDDPFVRECVQAFAVSLRLDGAKPADVEAYLVKEFGIDDASAIVDAAFARDAE